MRVVRVMQGMRDMRRTRGASDAGRPPRARLTALALAGLLLPALASGQPCPPPEVLPQVAPVAVLEVARTTLVRCTTRDLEAGRWAAAERRLEAAARAGIALPRERLDDWRALLARLHAIRGIDGGQWATLTREVVPFEEALPWVGPLVRGVAAARASWAQQDAALQASARNELQRLASLARTEGPLSEAEWARLLVQGAMAGAQYEREEMQLLLDAAHDLERRVLGGVQMRPLVMRARELEADLLRVTDRYAAAADRYRDVLTEAPHRVQARIGLADAYRRLGHTREADETLAQARALWADADAEAMALTR